MAHKYSKADLEYLFQVMKDDKSPGPQSYEEACKRYIPWVCPKCGHLMDIWPQQDKFVFKCGASRENLFDGINDEECSIAVVAHGYSTDWVTIDLLEMK